MCARLGLEGPDIFSCSFLSFLLESTSTESFEGIGGMLVLLFSWSLCTRVRIKIRIRLRIVIRMH